MPDFLYPQDGDYGDAADFASWVDHAGLYDYVHYGLDVTPDWANNQFDVAKGKAYIRADNETGARSGETRDGVVYEAFIDARTNIDFASSSGVNYIWIAADRDTSDDIVIFVTANSSAEPKDENNNVIPGFKFAELDAARQTVQYYNQGQDLEPQNLDFQGRLDDPSSPSLGEQWFREDEGVHYVELPGGTEQIPVAREFQVEDFEDQDISEYVGNTGGWSLDANASEGSNALRSSISSGSSTITNYGPRRVMQKGDTFSFDVLLGSQYTEFWFGYGLQGSGNSDPSQAGYQIRLDAQDNHVSIGSGSNPNNIAEDTSAPLIESEDEYITVTLSWGEDGTHRAVVTDNNGREISSIEGTDDSYGETTGYFFRNIQHGAGTAEVIVDNFRVIRPVENHLLDAEDTLYMGGEQTVMQGALHTGPLNAPKDAKGVHTDQPVTDALAAGDEVGYLFGIGATDLLDVYGEADGSGGVQNLALQALQPLQAKDALRLEDTNRETLSGAKTLSASDPMVQSLDPGGAGRDVNLPAEENGLVFVIANRADAAEALTIKDDGGTSLATVNQDDVAYAISDGTGWMVFAAAGGVS